MKHAIPTVDGTGNNGAATFIPPKGETRAEERGEDIASTCGQITPCRTAYKYGRTLRERTQTSV